MPYVLNDLPPELLLQNAEAWARSFYGTPEPLRKRSPDPFESECLHLSDAAELMGMKVEAAVGIVLERLAEVHEEYGQWTGRYSAEELSRGLWRMFSLPCWFNELLLNPALPFVARERVLRSLAVPYRVYVAGWNPTEPMPHGWHMLWDLILGHQRQPADFTDVCLQVLEEILAMPDVRCQSAALHGLNHLHHPERPRVVQRFINRCGAGWDLRQLEAFRDGTAM